MIYVILFVLVALCIFLVGKLLDARDKIEYQKDCISSGEGEIYELREKLKNENKAFKSLESENIDLFKSIALMSRYLGREVFIADDHVDSDAFYLVIQTPSGKACYCFHRSHRDMFASIPKAPQTIIQADTEHTAAKLLDYAEKLGEQCQFSEGETVVGPSGDKGTMIAYTRDCLSLMVESKGNRFIWPSRMCRKEVEYAPV
jgi:hypothetical protein